MTATSNAIGVGCPAALNVFRFVTEILRPLLVGIVSVSTPLTEPMTTLAVAPSGVVIGVWSGERRPRSPPSRTSAEAAPATG